MEVPSVLSPIISRRFIFRRDEITPIVKQMLGHNLITKQTPKEGIPVNKIMIAESVNIKRETYLCILMDRQRNGPIIIASPAGTAQQTIKYRQCSKLSIFRRHRH